jgi:hypothetical protein
MEKVPDMALAKNMAVVEVDDGVEEGRRWWRAAWRQGARRAGRRCPGVA